MNRGVFLNQIFNTYLLDKARQEKEEALRKAEEGKFQMN